MELHSYAKRKATPKKWTIDQKRKLVETRIAFEKLFAEKPRGSVLPWKTVLNLTNLDDYNVFFVRKQWANMVAKYKQYKQNRLGNIPSQAIDEEMVKTISQEWEFFGPIHEYMMRKTRNLHSYALQYDEEPTLEENSNSNSLSSYECVNHYSSDTNDAGELSNCIATPNTDHDLYSKKCEDEQQQKLSYFADASEDTQESSIMMEMKSEPECFTQSQINEVIISSTQQQKQTVPMDVQQENSVPVMESNNQIGEDQTNKMLPRKTQKHVLSERDRYYRHKRRFNRRFERRFDAFLQVMGQVVEAEYPTIDVSPLMGVVRTAKLIGSTLNDQIFSSDDEFEFETEDEIK